MTAHRREGDTASGTVDPVEVAAAAILEQELMPSPPPRRARLFGARNRRTGEDDPPAIDLDSWRPAPALREAGSDLVASAASPGHEALPTAVSGELEDLVTLAADLAPDDVVSASPTDVEVDERIHLVLQAGQAVEERARQVVDTLGAVSQRVAGLDRLTTDARALAEDAASTSRASLNVLIATEALALETQESLERRRAAEAEAEAAEQARRIVEEELALALTEQLAMTKRLTTAQEDLLHHQRSQSEEAQTAAAAIQDLHAALAAATEATAQAETQRRDADRALADSTTDLITARGQLTQALNENELLSQDLTQALRATTAAADEAREAQGRRLQADLAATVTAGAAREAQERAAAAEESGVRLQRQLEEQAAELRALLNASQDHLLEGRAEREAHQVALAEARDQVLTQAQERIRAETCVAELLEAARVGRGLGLVPRLTFSTAVGAHAPAAPVRAVVAEIRSANDETPPVANRLTVRKASPRVLLTTVGLALALVAAICFVSDASHVLTGVLAGLGALTLLLGHRFPRSATVEVVGSVVHVRQDASSHVFDLADPRLRVETEGAADSRSWKVLFHRRGLSPIVLSRHDVDPAQFAGQLERWRGDLVS